MFVELRAERGRKISRSPLKKTVFWVIRARDKFSSPLLQKILLGQGLDLERKKLIS